ncbi:DUF3658 domain-containing protein [Nocardia gipuzkoensis]|uniref:DUF3658 domain-containing protein n=1 Tax=Nocardia gipuzkoensis TaxID=2749991 RepID=UPI0015EEB2AA|nr:DUF3658 domain-containing protein [Nocardia gipuzkoensis]
MATLHIAPNVAAGAGIRTALADASSEGTVLVNNEDFSCGPIDPAALGQRESVGELSAHLATAPDAQVIVWVGRGSAQELSFYLYFAARFGERPWSVVDVTGLRLPVTARNGDERAAAAVPEEADTIKPARSVAELNPGQIRLLLSSARPVSTSEREELADRWHFLQAENAPLRVVTDAGLSSASADYFDQSLLTHTPVTPTPMARVIADTMGAQPLPVTDSVLHRRLIDMIHAGRLTADGDPTVMGECRISSGTR